MLTTEDFKYIEDVIDEIKNKSKDLKRVYISGPVSKYNDDVKACQIFNDCKQTLHERFNRYFTSIYIVNPIEINMNLPSYKQGKPLEWGDFMTVDLMLLSICDNIYMLPNWPLSSGASCEYKFATINEIKELKI